MSGINKVILLGHLGRDPEIRRTQAGDPVASFSIATSESWRDKASGERKERTEWHSVVIFNEGLAKIAEQYLSKGSKVYIEGQMRTRDYQDKDGITRRVSEVVLARFRGDLVLLDKQGGGRPPPADDLDDYGTLSARDKQATGLTMAARIDDDIPF